jgi:hypothetical protein
LAHMLTHLPASNTLVHISYKYSPSKSIRLLFALKNLRKLDQAVFLY